MKTYVGRNSAWQPDGAEHLIHYRNVREAVSQGGIKAEVGNARRRIAAVAGVPIEAVRITIDFGV